ncbi:Hypothetical protein R9X50_00684500 [Acrodontium crateriforme]|uniref:F-box domain-containing protein n=1 Tax=Acrodontium crateriforme TaxID=150365 RepID=A0AAQ3MDJ9_9PEZI|nr:Hypothetical protein R9X50_00684500 [Acrodontium crateriforme]
MSLNELPSELIMRIVSYLPSNKGFRTHTGPQPKDPKNNIAPYSAICKAWQPIIEERCFALLELTSDDLDKFEQLVAAVPSRGASLRVLLMTIILPSYSIADRGRFERQIDQEANNTSFSTQTVRLFQVLSRLETTKTSKPLSLIMYSPRSPADVRHWLSVPDERDIGERRYKHSHIRLTLPDQIVPAQRVTNFECQTDLPRLLAPSTLVHLANKMPNVEGISWSLSDAERNFPALRRQIRQELGDSLKSLSCLKLRKIDISFRHEATGDDNYISADVRSTLTFQDPLGPSISQGLSRQAISQVLLQGPICIDGGLFWTGDENPIWSNVERFIVDFSTVRPDGDYYFDRDPHEGDGSSGSSSDDDNSDHEFDDEVPDFEEYTSFLQWADGRQAEFDPYDEVYDERRTGRYHYRVFRTYPNDSIEPVLEAAARGAAYMPRLKTMSAGADMMSCRRTGRDTPSFDFRYAVAGTRISAGEEEHDVARPRLYWTVPKGWRMTPSLDKLWQILLGPSGFVRYSEW